MVQPITKTRLEAFSDGVIAIIITIMVLELQPPAGADLAALKPLLATLAGYAISFVYVGIYWNSHHHMLRAVRGISGAVMWANHHLLFWLSMIPFATAWMEQSHFARVPVAAYGVALFATGFGFKILTASLVRHEGRDSDFAVALKGDRATHCSLGVYAVGVTIAFFAPVVSLLLYAGVATIWLLPDRRVAHLANGQRHGESRVD